MAVTGKEIVALLHTFCVNDSEAVAEAPAASGLGNAEVTKLVLVSPTTVLTMAVVLPVLVTLYTKSNFNAAQLSAVTKLLNLLQSTPDEPPRVHVLTATCQNKKHFYVSNLSA